jgi:hypothetical protein
MFYVMLRLERHVGLLGIVCRIFVVS